MLSIGLLKLNSQAECFDNPHYKPLIRILFKQYSLSSQTVPMDSLNKWQSLLMLSLFYLI